MDISKRHEAIINAIVSMYINDREPVASSALQDYLDMALSSATLRNEMAYLTKQGFLNQPHVSAGRVPTNKAYRYYIENLDHSNALSKLEKDHIKARFDLLDQDSQRFLQGAAELFSEMFGVTTIIAPPLDKDLKFVNFNIMKTGKYAIVLIGVVYIVFRSLGKYFGTFASAKMAKCSPEICKYLGITLLPQAGVALGMCTIAAAEFGEAGILIRNITLFAVLVYEISIFQ